MTNRTNAFKLKVDTYKFMRQLHLKHFFSPLNRNPSYSVTAAQTDTVKRNTPFHKKSSFVPSTNLSPIITTFSKLVETDLEAMIKNDHGPKYHNLSGAERRALEELDNTDIVIRAADKGGAIVLLDSQYYNNKMLQHLSTPSYRELPSNPVNEYKNEIDNLLKCALESDWITRKEHEFLSTQFPITAVMYSLPKIHKHPTEPPIRPIISGIGSITEPLSQFVDFFLKDLVASLPSYLRDTKDVLNALKEATVDSSTLLVALDVESLYTCIPHDKGLEATAHFLAKDEPMQNPPNAFILELLNLVLNKNYFCYDGRFFLQIQGTAMGTAAAPNYANLTVGLWEQNAIHDSNTNPYHSKIKMWKRYIDDILLFWDGTEDELKHFLAYVNSSTPFLKFSMEFDTHTINFLDLTITKDARGDIRTSIYRKPMERNTLLHANSNHPNHLKTNIPTGQFLRLRRNCSDPLDFETKAEDLKNRFKHRNYSSHCIENAYQRAKNTSRSTLLLDKDQKQQADRLCFVTEFNHCSSDIKRIILKHWHILQAETTLKSITQTSPLFSFRRAQTIKSTLVHTSGQEKKTGNWLNIVGNYKCGNCAHCNNTTNSKYFKHPRTGRKYYIKQFINCTSTHCVYMLTCPCGLSYVGQTKRCLKVRIAEHKTAIRTGNLDYAMAKHYVEAGHGSPASLRFIGLERVSISIRGGDLLKALAQREMFWIYTLNSMVPIGLNDDFSFKCFL